MVIKDKLMKEYPLTKKMECDFECYEVKKRRYVIFYDKKIQKGNIEALLDKLKMATENNFSKAKSLIVVGITDEEFEKEDLLYFNGVDTFVVYYLKNVNNDKIYFNDQSCLLYRVGWKKIVKKFNEILNVSH